jgi:hypothetical protein
MTSEHLTKMSFAFTSKTVPRLLGLFVALLVVLVGLGRPDIPAAAATVQQATSVPDPDHGADPPLSPAESDDDDDCNEESAAPSRFRFTVSFPKSSFDPLLPCGIRPSQGHGEGPEKPPRA